MAMERMEALLKQELAQLERSGMRKSREAIITGVVPPRRGAASATCCKERETARFSA